MKKIVECIPNFSEGRNKKVINSIVDEINSVDEVAVLHTDKGFDANRTVITFAGSPEKVVHAAFLAIKKAAELIDMQKQTGAHPRMGATDVCPLVPVKGITTAETILLAEKLAERVAKELGIQVYLYEQSAKFEARKSLANCRKGEYEGMQAKVNTTNWKPDFGPEIFNSKAGVTVIGARKFLIAYNVNLDSKDTKLAKKIAGIVRESGFLDAHKNRVAGKLKKLRAIGWYMEEYQLAQVSTNLIDIETTPIHTVFETIKSEAKRLNSNVKGSELIGLIPLSALIKAGKYYCSKNDLAHRNSELYLINCAIEHLGLNQLLKFNPNERILEYALNSKLDENTIYSS